MKKILYVKPYAQEAENLRMLLFAGIVTVEEVVKWADEKILTLPEYDDDLANISLGAKLENHEMDMRLRHISGGANASDGIRNLLGHMHRILLSDRSRAQGFAPLLDHIWQEAGGDENSADLSFIYGIDDAFYLAESGISGSLNEVIDELIAATAPFDTATSGSMPTLPVSSQGQLGPPEESVKGFRERLRRFFRGRRR